MKVRRMLLHPAASLKAIRPFAPGPARHDDVAFDDKTFLYLGVHEDQVSVGVKLQVSGAEALRLPNAKPMAYGPGKSSWVSIAFHPSAGPPLETIKR